MAAEKVSSQHTSKGSSVTLYNRFVELMLVIGLDENTGLVPIRNDTDSEDGDDIFSRLYYDEYEAQVLAAISSSKALVFQPCLMEDPNYPPSAEALAGMGNVFTLRPNKPSDAGGQSIKKSSQHRNTAVNPAFVTKQLNRADSTGNSNKLIADLPLSKDAIESITTFCFPENIHVHREKPDNVVHFLVLTDVSGSKTYACCLTFFKPYKLEKDEMGQIKYTMEPNMGQPEEHTAFCYFPQCCVLVSKYPYFYAMKECLSCMISHVERDLEEMFTFLKDFTYTMTLAPVPPAGNVIVEICVYNLFVSLFPSEWPEKPVLDIPLHLVFLCFHIDDLLKIFTAVLCEERLVFVSFNYALLTTVMESFLYYILPFSWRFTYVPILSASSLELLEAPGTFMMGCHSKHLDVVEQVEGLVVVNIDDGTVSVNKATTHRHTLQRSSSQPDFLNVTAEDSTIPLLPVEPTNLFKKICNRAKFQMELSDVQRPFFYDIEMERAFRMKKCLQFNTEISFAFLEMMVNLFRNVLPFLRPELRRFNKQQFLDSIEECDRPFYEKVLNTDMFKQFLEDRMNEKVDYWSDYEVKTRPYAKRFSTQLDLSLGQTLRKQMKPSRSQVSISTYSSLAPRVFEILQLPALNNAQSYVKHSIALLNKSIDECNSLHHRSSYIYLRGMFHAAEGNILAALDDLLSLYAHNARLIPVNLVRKLLYLVTESEKEEMLRKKGVSLLSELAIEEDTMIASRRGFTDKVVIPDSDLSLEDFVETVSLLEMATDYDTIQRLFLALAQPQRLTHVEKYTFEMLHLSYEENQSQCESLHLPEGCLQLRECILRVSNLIKTDFGMGRIVLTDKRLFYIKDVTNLYKEIVKLRNIASLEKVQFHSLLTAVDALVICDDKKNKFTAWLKDERNAWAMLIDEMRAGKIVAEATKDFTAIEQAVQNVLLVDAIIRSGNDERVTHHSHVVRAAETLCHFTDYMSEGRHNLPKDTIHALQHRVDPNSGQRERKTVEVMLYTAGSQHSGASTNTPPRLWCGMGDGKVKVFDATNWSLERSFVQTKHTVAALIGVGESQVWAGSHGIFIIDTETITCNKTLTEHPDLVADLVLDQNGRHAYSASVDGTIIIWEVQTLRKLRMIQLKNTRSLRSIKIYDDKIWCGTWQNITARDMDGNLLQTFEFMDPSNGKLVEIDCFDVFSDEIWAGCRREGRLIVWDEKTTLLKKTLSPDCRGISCMLLVGSKVWVGTKDGTVYIYNSHTKQQWKTIKAHDDAVRSLCAAEARYIMSGAGSKDGKVAIWSPNSEASEIETSSHE